MQPPYRDRSERALQALVALARRRHPDQAPLDLSDGDAREALIAAAARHAMPGLLLVALERLGTLTETERGQLHLLRRQAARWDLERERVLRRLSGSQIRTMVLKGAALRATAFRDPAEREFTDVDLLVRRDMLEPAVEALCALGYQPPSERERQLYLAHHHHLILSHPQGFVVELHWGLEPPGSPFRIDAERVWNGAVEVTPPGGGARMLVPRAEHMVLHLAHQNLENGFGHLRRLVDVDRAIAAATDFDWGFLAAESEQMRVRPSVALSLRLAEVMLGTEVPAGFVAGLGVSGMARRHLAMLDPVRVMLEQRGERREVEESLYLWCLPGAGARFGLLGQVATGKREWFWRQVEGLPGNPLGNLWALARLLGYQVVQYRRIGAAGKFWTKSDASHVRGARA